MAYLAANLRTLLVHDRDGNKVAFATKERERGRENPYATQYS